MPRFCASAFRKSSICKKINLANRKRKKGITIVGQYISK